MTRALLLLAALCVLASAAPVRAEEGGAEKKPQAESPAPRSPQAPDAPGPKRKEPSELEAIRIEFLYRCVRSFGHTDYCRCLDARRPGAVDFDAFILFTSRTPKELGYEELSGTDRKLVEGTLAARDACVEIMGLE